MGSELWRTDMRGYVLEIQRVCMQDYEIAHIAFQVLQYPSFSRFICLFLVRLSTKMSWSLEKP
jgi:hypothetical protein